MFYLTGCKWIIPLFIMLTFHVIISLKLFVLWETSQPYQRFNFIYQCNVVIGVVTIIIVVLIILGLIHWGVPLLLLGVGTSLILLFKHLEWYNWWECLIIHNYYTTHVTWLAHNSLLYLFVAFYNLALCKHISSTLIYFLNHANNSKKDRIGCFPKDNVKYLI